MKCREMVQEGSCACASALLTATPPSRGGGGNAATHLLDLVHFLLWLMKVYLQEGKNMYVVEEAIRKGKVSMWK